MTIDWHFPVFVAVSFVAFAGVLRAVVRQTNPLETWARVLSVAVVVRDPYWRRFQQNFGMASLKFALVSALRAAFGESVRECEWTYIRSADVRGCHPLASDTLTSQPLPRRMPSASTPRYSGASRRSNWANDTLPGPLRSRSQESFVAARNRLMLSSPMVAKSSRCCSKKAAGTSRW